jgi:hypothetical protein
MKLLLFLFCIGIITSGNSQPNTYSFVFLNKKVSPTELPKEEVDKIMKGHMENIDRLAKEGKINQAAPY